MSQAERAAHMLKLSEERRKRQRRDNLEDGITVLLLVAIMFLVGWRAHAVYGVDEPNVARCAAEDEVSVLIAEDAFGLDAGESICIRIDNLSVSG